VNLILLDGESVTDKPSKPKWSKSNSVVDRINSGGYDSHVHLHVNSAIDGSPTVVVSYVHSSLAD